MLFANVGMRALMPCETPTASYTGILADLATPPWIPRSASVRWHESTLPTQVHLAPATRYDHTAHTAILQTANGQYC